MICIFKTTDVVILCYFLNEAFLSHLKISQIQELLT